MARTARPIAWTNTLFIGATHLVGFGAVAYMSFVHFSWWTLGLGILWFLLCGLAITGGYHRLFAHRAYEAHPLVRATYLFFGAASVQNSALEWCTDHRVHHAQCDQERDPYNIRRGFWWAHIGWVLHQTPDTKEERRFNDLRADPLVRFQHRHYIVLAVVAGVLLPFLLGTIWRDPFGALLVAGFLRLVVQWHMTFSVNSLAHTIGERPYGDRNSARDSLIVALVTLGEGYHAFHHRFPNDYRNGVRWYHLDPTKWITWTLARVRLTRNLRKTPWERIRGARIAPAPVERHAADRDEG